MSYTAEKGNVHVLPTHGRFQVDYRIGALDADAAKQMEAKIEAIVAK